MVLAPEVVGAWCRRLTPELTRSAHKGSCGRLALIAGAYDGGSFATLSAAASLRVGVDLVYVMTRTADRPFVHSLSVRPLLEPAAIETAVETLHRCDCVSIADNTLPPDPSDAVADPDTVNALSRIVYEDAALDLPIVVGGESLKLHAVRIALHTAVKRAPSEWPILTCAGDWAALPCDIPSVVVGVERARSECVVRTMQTRHGHLALVDTLAADGRSAQRAVDLWRPGMNAVLHGALGTFGAWNRLLPPPERLPSYAVAAVATSVVVEAAARAHARAQWPLSVLPSHVIDHLSPAVQTCCSRGDGAQDGFPPFRE